jgi:hypothetical protein
MEIKVGKVSKTADFIGGLLKTSQKKQLKFPLTSINLNSSSILRQNRRIEKDQSQNQ